jgi:hypothetical protein
MLPTPKEYSDLFDHMLTNDSLGSPRKVNMYKTYGYFADTPLNPLDVLSRPLKYYGKTLKVHVELSEKGHMTKWNVKDPSIEDITKALKSIEHGEYHSFVILSKSKQSYIQTNVYCLEYRDGSMDKHYYCPPEYLSSMTVQKAFVSYAQGCAWWKNKIPWKKV